MENNGSNVCHYIAPERVPRYPMACNQLSKYCFQQWWLLQCTSRTVAVLHAGLGRIA